MGTDSGTGRSDSASGFAVLKSVCRGCHGGCGTLLHVDGGQLVKVVGDPESPMNRGRLCPIGLATLDLVYHPDRLKVPLRRTGERGEGKWARITWDEALDEIAGKLQAIIRDYGAESIALGTGTGRHHIRWVSRFGNALGTPNWCEPGFAQCFHPRVNTSMLTLGDFPVCDYTGEVPPECIVYWGHNPLNSGPDGETRFSVRDALKHNPKIIVVDPRRTRLAKRADVWLQLRPGTDDALALSLLHVLINEELYDKEFVARWTHGLEALAERVAAHTPEWAEPITWVPAETIRAAARLYARTKPSMMEWGVAIEHTPNCIQTVRAVSMLPALTGNIDVPGGWVFGMHGLGRFPSLIEALPAAASRRRLGADTFRMLGGAGAALPAAHIPTLLKAMREGVPYPIKAFLIFGNNTLATYGNTKLVYESITKVDLLVAADLFMTPTTELADIVLPAAAWPELDEVAGLPTIAANVVFAQQKAVQIGECKADEEMFIELARKMDLAVGTEDLHDVLDAMVMEGLGITFEELKTRGHVAIPMRYRKYEQNGFNTPTGKIELYSTRMEELGYDPLPYYEEPPESPLSQPALTADYPLVLTTGGRTPVFFHSEHRQIARLRKVHPDPLVDIHPDTAATLGIADGEWVSIVTRRGKIRQKAKLNPGIHPEVVNIEAAWWFPEEPGPEYGIWKSNANVLTDNTPPFDPAMGTYQLRAFLCRLEKIE